MSLRDKVESITAQTQPQQQDKTLTQVKSWVRSGNHQSATPPTRNSNYMKEQEKSNT